MYEARSLQPVISRPDNMPRPHRCIRLLRLIDPPTSISRFRAHYLSADQPMRTPNQQPWEDRRLLVPYPLPRNPQVQSRPAPVPDFMACRLGSEGVVGIQGPPHPVRYSIQLASLPTRTGRSRTNLASTARSGKPRSWKRPSLRVPRATSERCLHRRRQLWFQRPPFPGWHLASPSEASSSPRTSEMSSQHQSPSLLGRARVSGGQQAPPSTPPKPSPRTPSMQSFPVGLESGTLRFDEDISF